MIKCERNQYETVITAEGSVDTIAADACEIIRAIYWRFPPSERPLFRKCVELAISHKDSPMWKSSPLGGGASVSVCSEAGELARQVEALRRGGADPKGGNRRDKD